MSMAGNSYDKSLLMASMLAHWGYEVRFLRTTLKKSCSASSISRPTDAWEQIPETLFHKVTIRVAAEEREAGNLRSRSILNYTDFAANLNGARVTLSWRFSGSEDEWSATPVLHVADKSIEGDPLTGHSDAADIVSAAKQGTKMLGKDIFFTPTHAASANELVAAYLQFDFSYPSGHKETVSRE